MLGKAKGAVVIIHEDEHCIAFHEPVNVTKVHFIVLARSRQMECLAQAKTADDEKLLGHLMVVVSKVARA